MSNDEVSIGSLFEKLTAIQVNADRIRKVTTEIYEKQIATEVHSLADVLDDVIYLVREHLSCHDCQVVDHSHGVDGRRGTGVEIVYDGVVERVDE